MCQNKIFIEYIYFVSVELRVDSEVLLCCTCWGHFTFSWLETMKTRCLTVLQKEMVEENLN